MRFKPDTESCCVCAEIGRNSPRAASRHDGDGKLKRTPPMQMLQALFLTSVLA